MQIPFNRRWFILFSIFFLFILTVAIGADLRLIPTKMQGIPYFDKAGHFFLYGILAGLLHLALQGRALHIGRFSIPIAIISIALLCAFDEFQQSFIPYRAFDAQDYAADIVGILFFVLLAAQILKRKIDQKREGITISA